MADKVRCADLSPWQGLAPSARRVALEVLLHGPLARTELAQRLNLSTASLTRLTRPMLDRGLLLEVDETPVNGGGRPQQPLDVDATTQHFVGVKLTGETAYGVLTDLRAGILAAQDAVLDSHEPEQIVALLADLVRDLTIQGERPAAIGIGIGGQARDLRHVARAPFLGWRDVDLGGLLSERTGTPVIVANDLDALMEAEHWFGLGRDVRHFAALTIGTAVGGGLVAHDRLVTGPDAGLGLLGHFPLDPLGPACPDGHRGCANAMLSMDAIRVHASMALGRTVTYDQVLDLAAAGDPIADHIVGNAAHAFGALIAAVANIALPERVLLTGEGIRLAHVGQARLQAGIAANRNPAASPIDVRLIDNDPHVWARGAAGLALRHTVLATVPRY